ncbi:MAG: hypothetical protein H6551_12260 [Chitinophagales bacterium]|nr:hypothetical protein [Chitinophagaceae bacterium]MCB9065903.1 hypothetical protein [Chitinophagales bacterium]
MKRIAITLTILFAVVFSFAQDKTDIDLSNTSIAYAPQNFYIKHVVDRRDETDAIGEIQEGTIDIHGGVANGLTDYLHNKVVWKKNATPVVMQIKKLSIKETAVDGKRQFDISITIIYFKGDLKLIEYSGSAYVQSINTYESAIQRLITSNIESNLKRFDTWMKNNESTVTAEPTVTVKVSITDKPQKPNHILYNNRSQLYISDFECEPDMKSYGAAGTFSGIGTNYSSRKLHNKTDVDVVLYVYFDKTMSWMKPNGKNATTLGHEQRHFDITAIKTCEIKKRVEEMTFTPENYEKELTNLFHKLHKEAEDMQNQYDEETEHGTVIDKQEEWDKKVAESLKKYNCF